MPLEEPRDIGPVGDAACWIESVCPECGALVEEELPAKCWRCGNLVERV